MYRTQLVIGLTIAFAAISVWFGVLAVTFNPLILAPALLFAAVAYFMWYHASGRLAARVYRRAERAGTRAERVRADGRGGFGAEPRGDWERRGAATRERVRQRRAGGAARGRRTGTRGAGAGGVPGARPDQSRMGRREAADVLGVDPTADEETVRSAYRDRIKEVHPDTGTGDEEAFKRVREAYERLSS